MSTSWYLQDKNYFSGYEREEIEKVYGVFDEFLSQSAETYEITVDGISKNIIIQSTQNYNERRILFKEDDLTWGNIITHENEKWLVTERPFFNKIHEKSKIQLCNNTIEFAKEVEGVIDHRDQFSNIIWDVPPSTQLVNFPCVLESISELNSKTTTGEQINVPEGDMVLQISYTTDELIDYGNEFKMFNNTYRISGIDNSKVHNNQGVIILVVSRTANNT